MNYSDLVRKCIGNSICIVEYFKQLVEKGIDFSEDVVKYVTSLLGEPSRKIDVFRDKYIQVFLRNIQRNCVSVESGEICIYTWMPGRVIRYHPVGLDSTGTILYFHDNDISVLAYPVSRTIDIEGHGVSIPDPTKHSIVEITSRVDGYAITFYYNPIVKKWLPATRYVLHNMYYAGRRLEISDINEITNPYASIAFSIVEESGLINYFKGREGWTFTFILEAPEPAVIKPNIELFNKESFKLYLLTARTSDGNLLTIRETSELIKWNTVPLEEYRIEDRETLEKYISNWRNDLTKRSRFVRFNLGDTYRPFVLEVSSKLYVEAVNVKYYSNPKSLLILASYGFEKEALELLVDYKDIKDAGREIVAIYRELLDLIPKVIDSKAFIEILQKMGVEKELRSEYKKTLETRVYDRFIRKLLSLIAGDDIYEARRRLRELKDILLNNLSQNT
ncbi:MAG: hypothetical protein QXL68_06210 [Desulfurococcaceae archaeon]